MAAPNPEHELERLRRLLQKPLPPVVVLAGDGAWFRDRAVEAVLAAVPAAAELATVDGQLTDVRGLAADGGGSPDGTDGAGADGPDGDGGAGGDAGADAGPARACPDLEPLRGGGLFASVAFVVVRRGDRWLRRYGPALAAFLPRIAAGSTLVLEVQKLDKRTRLAKELLQASAVFEFRNLYETPFGQPDRPLEGELCRWVLARGKKLGVALAPEAALLLCAQVGRDPGALCAELQRLRDQLGGDPAREPLGPDDLRGRLTTGFESTPFELAEAVLAGDRPRAFRSLRAMFDRGVRQRDGRAMDPAGLFPFTTSWLFRALGEVHEGRLLLDAGTPLRSLPTAVGVQGFVDRWLEQVRRNPAARLEQGLRALLCCQREKRLTGEDDDVLLERFLCRWFEGAPVPEAAELEW